MRISKYNRLLFSTDLMLDNVKWLIAECRRRHEMEESK